ncbi:hypothetical protein B566_EDAN004378 [Ephemera danica]|nr:hypothetical protein B566_EDAN004378 [Ephemera danica]
MATDLVLVTEYSLNGYYLWAGLTLLLVVVPTLVVEAFSIRWHALDGKVSTITWISHVLCLGIAHRYILALQTAANGTAQNLLHQQQDLCLLHLFNSFLEAAPQLVLQLYVTAKLGNIPPWTGLSLLASLLSLAWAIAGYTRAMRLCRPDKQPVSWAALVLQAVWRAGTLTARIIALACCIAWAIWQRTDFCETWWEERAYNAVVGVIYCFCFFNLQEGPSRHRATAFYVIAAVENALCVTAYALWGGEQVSLISDPSSHIYYVKLVVMAVSLATVLGLSSMLVYYAFFHPAGVILPCIPALDDCEARQNLSGSSLGADIGRSTLRSLRHEQPGGSRAVTPQRPPSSIANSTTLSDDSPNTSKQQQFSSLTPNNAQESPASTSEAHLKRRPVCDISLSDIEDDLTIEIESPSTETVPSRLKRSPLCKTDLLQTGELEESPKSEDQLKRRPIYDIDLTEIELPKPECKTAEEWEADEVATVTASEDKGLGDETDVTSSICMSTHDYENICAVNITREPWGLRHWDGYSSDIAEHDSSVAGGVDGVRDRRRDTLVSTSTSYYSSSSSSSGDKLAANQPRCSEYLDSLAEELKIAEADEYTYIAQPYVIDHAGVCYPLDTIIEEEASYETSSEDATIIAPNQKTSNSKLTNSCSSLVATIEEIRLSASLCNLYSPDEGLESIMDTTLDWEGSENLDQEWESEIGASVQRLDNDNNEFNDGNWQNNKPLSQTEIDFLAQLKTSEIKNTPPKKIRRKFSLLRERFEVGCSAKGDGNDTGKDDIKSCQRPEVATVTSRIQQWNSLLRGRGSTPRSGVKAATTSASSVLPSATGGAVVTLFPVAS